MTKKIDLVGRNVYKYNDLITVKIPTLGQIRGEGNDDIENRFWKEVNLFIKTPSDMISELDSMGIDFEQLSEYMLFVMLLTGYLEDKNNGFQLFEGLDFRKLQLSTDGTGQLVFIDENGAEVFNEVIYIDISNIIATMISTEKTPKKKFGNDFAKKMRIKQDYKKKAKARNEQDENDGVLGSIILRLCCNANFPYDFTTIKTVTVYDVFQSIKQIDKDLSVTDVMQSRLVGADLNKLPKEALSRYV